MRARKSSPGLPASASKAAVSASDRSRSPPHRTRSPARRFRIATIPALNARVACVGERRALTLGLDPCACNGSLLGVAALLTAAAVALSGLVGFVGLIVPHIARRLIGADLRFGVPAAIALGAALVIVADAASRALLAPLEIPLGVLLAFIGVPAFLYLYLRGSARTYA